MLKFSNDNTTHESSCESLYFMLQNANETTKQEIKVVFHLSSLTGQTSQFLNWTHEFAELVLARMSLLMDQRASQFFRSGQPKRGNLESCGGKNAPAGLSTFKNWPEPVVFGRPDRRNGKRPKQLWSKLGQKQLIGFRYVTATCRRWTRVQRLTRILSLRTALPAGRNDWGAWRPLAHEEHFRS